MTTIPATERPARKIHAGLFIGIALLPIVFAWFSLRSGYTARARIIAFGWMILLEGLFIASGASLEDLLGGVLAAGAEG
jgi:hypothetical protein